MPAFQRDIMLAPSGSWSRPSGWPPLGANEVHVWRVALDIPAAELPALRQTLSDAEADRADHLFFERDRARFIVAHAALRDILARYAGIRPGQLRFATGPHGQPQLHRDLAIAQLTFSLAHSSGLALVAVSLRRALGVDLEYIRPYAAGLEIAQRRFAPEEAAALGLLPQPTQTEAFFHCWTCKEAYAKADGRGLLLPFDQFVVSVMPDQPASLLETKWDRQEARHWSLMALHPEPGLAAALAVRGHAWDLRLWEWEGCSPKP